MSTLIKTPGRYVSPFSTSFQDLFDRIFSEGQSPALPASFVPQADVVETPEAYLINLAVPGMHKEDFALDLEEGVLVVSGERKRKHVEHKEGYHRAEIAYGSFRRSFRLPDDMLPDQVEAQYADGLLEVRLPKDAQKTRKRTITVA
jgi:HSP20 family protein